MITYHFNEKDGILNVKFEGVVSTNDMLNYILDLQNDEKLPQKLKILSEATEAKFAEKVGRKELLKFLEENKKSLSQREFVYDAFIVSGSFETALGMIYKELIKVPNYKFNVFSTKQAALNWLKKTN